MRPSKSSPGPRSSSGWTPEWGGTCKLIPVARENSCPQLQRVVAPSKPKGCQPVGHWCLGSAQPVTGGGCGGGGGRNCLADMTDVLVPPPGTLRPSRLPPRLESQGALGQSLSTKWAAEGVTQPGPALAPLASRCCRPVSAAATLGAHKATGQEKQPGASTGGW